MGQRCSICSHPRRDTIDRLLVEGRSFRDVAADFGGFSISSLSRHRRNHLSPALIALAAQQKAEQDASLLARVERLIDRAETLLTAAEQSGSTSTALTAIRELRSLLELLGKATGELDERPQVTVNLLTSTEWTSVRDAMLAALVAYPEARAAVAGRLLELEAGPS